MYEQETDDPALMARLATKYAEADMRRATLALTRKPPTDRRHLRLGVARDQAAATVEEWSEKGYAHA